MTTAATKILVFIPAYRCERQIGRVLSQFSDPAISRQFDKILVLDNRSPDGTASAAISQARALALGKVTVARNEQNYGLGGSHKAAFCHAIAQGFTHVVVLHGDDQGSIRDVLPVLRADTHLTHDCCLGARFTPKAKTIGYSAFRVFGNHAFNLLFSAVCGQRLYDLGSGLNVYAICALQQRYWWKFPDDLTFNYCMILAHVTRHDRFIFFPITWREDDQLSNVKLVRQARRTLKMLAEFAIDRQRFLAREFRSEPRDSYSFESIAEDL